MDLNINENKKLLVGIIAEDDSDVDSVNVLIKRITNNERIGEKKFLGKGCGKIKNKAKRWANILKEKGCSSLILIQDLDKNDLSTLEYQLNEILNPSPFKNYLICIPIKEFEAWLLSDTSAIKEVFSLSNEPKIKGELFDIDNPKEYLSNLVLKYTNNRKRYINTIHNSLIARNVSIEKLIKKNPSFIPFYNFVNVHLK